MSRYEHLNELDSQLEAIDRLADAKIDISVLRELILEDAERIKKGHDAFKARNAGAECRTWSTVECASPAGTIQQIINQMPRRTPIAWGGSSCFTWGHCRYCTHYECRLPVSPD
jgi:hypothetical protein